MNGCLKPNRARSECAWPVLDPALWSAARRTRMQAWRGEMTLATDDCLAKWRGQGDFL